MEAGFPGFVCLLFFLFFFDPCLKVFKGKISIQDKTFLLESWRCSVPLHSLLSLIHLRVSTCGWTFIRVSKALLMLSPRDPIHLSQRLSENQTCPLHTCVSYRLNIWERSENVHNCATLVVCLGVEKYSWSHHQIQLPWTLESLENLNRH